MRKRSSRQLPFVNYYPAFLNLNGKKAVVVGGGAIAERKTLSLLKAGAAVTVVSPVLTPRLNNEKTKKSITHITRCYRKGDLRGSILVVAATDDPSVNRQVAADAPALVNVVDVPTECSFVVPSVIKRGPLTIAISTGGVSPAFSKTMRQELEKIYGPEIGRYLNFVADIRKKALAGISDKKKRSHFLKDLASGSALARLRRTGFLGVRKSVEEKLAKLI
ncbi:MAG: bifunctional precorrin-2 dehydrogenase/sirohydrochlorin ferrochelatase [Nitrospirae bacterium]|nr:bifunctional precorrin-2 dehydrogenase/sirohydrochlorin ferrochelatase [Nitrospirota bacterium]